MFSKVIVLLFLAASAIAIPMAGGIYRITNVASHTTARVYKAGDQIYVSSTLENPGPFELWDINSAGSNGFTIRNVGLNTFAAVRQPVGGEPVITDSDPTVFNIEPAGNGAYIIKLQYDDLLWNAEPPVVPRGNVAIRYANGEDTQKWLISHA